MKRLFLITSGLTVLAAPAYAGTCSITPVPKEDIFWSQCQGASKETSDDVTWFIDKPSLDSTDTSVAGSLTKNLTGAPFDDILFTASTTGAIDKTGSGNATIKGNGSELTSFTFTMIPNSELGPKQNPTPFLGVDGMFMRGLVDGTGVEVTIDWGDGKSDSNTFAVSTGGDIGEISFDELLDPGELVTSITVTAVGLPGTTAFFDQVKQVDFSLCATGGCDSGVPTQFGGVPESSTWAMLILGFAGLGFAGSRARKHTAALAV
jgi:hypothetical protein